MFVFEYDTRNALDWRQLTEVCRLLYADWSLTKQLPSLFFFLLGLFMWLNFMTINAMYLYWPVVLIGLTVIIMFLPFQVLYHRSRKWWAFSNVSTLLHCRWFLTRIVASSTCGNIPS